MIVIALPAAFFVREPIRAPPAAPPRCDAASLKRSCRRPPFYLLAVGSMASIGAVGGTMQNLKLYLSLDRKLPQVEIATTLSLILVGSIVGRLLMGWLADRWPKKHVMLLIYAIVAPSIPLLVFAPTPASLKVCAFLFGIGLGGDYMIIPLMAAELFGLAFSAASWGSSSPPTASRSAGADGRGRDARPHRQLRVRLPAARGARRAGRAGGRVPAASGPARRRASYANGSSSILTDELGDSHS